MLKDLSSKTVYELDREDFEKLFCQHCKDDLRCAKDQKTINMCMGLIDGGL